jgi:hypothetical protein
MQIFWSLGVSWIDLFVRKMVAVDIALKLVPSQSMLPSIVTKIKSLDVCKGSIVTYMPSGMFCAKIGTSV